MGRCIPEGSTWSIYSCKWGACFWRLGSFSFPRVYKEAGEGKQIFWLLWFSTLFCWQVKVITLYQNPLFNTIDWTPQGKPIDRGTFKTNIRDKILWQPWSVYRVCVLVVSFLKLIFQIIVACHPGDMESVLPSSPYGPIWSYKVWPFEHCLRALRIISWM